MVADVSVTQGAGAGREHRARQLDLRDVDESSLIVTASEKHVGRIMTMRPAAQAKTYTLLQAARIMRWRGSLGVQPPLVAPDDRLAWLLDELSAHRGLAPRIPAAAVPSRTGLLGRIRREKPPIWSDSLSDAHEGGAHHSEIYEPLLDSVAVVAQALGLTAGHRT